MAAAAAALRYSGHHYGCLACQKSTVAALDPMSFLSFDIGGIHQDFVYNFCPCHCNFLFTFFVAGMAEGLKRGGA